MSLGLLSVVIVLICSWLANRIRKIGSRERGLPPGPPTVPILGNLHMFPRSRAHFKFTEWSKSYGDIFSLKMGSGAAIVLCSPLAVREVLDKRSATTADRAPKHIAEITHGGLNLVSARYGPIWKHLRRAMHDVLTREACARHLPIQQAEATQLMYDLLKEPDGFYTHIERYSASVILSVGFGIRCPRYSSSLISEFFDVQRDWVQILRAGATPPIDKIPILKYVPQRWAPWKVKCREIRRKQRKLYFGLVDACERRIAEGKRNGCFMENVLDNQEKYKMNREMIGYFGGVMLEGGADTTAVWLQSLVCCLVTHPEVQIRAHEEIDKVVGVHRSPTIEDIQTLPYVRAIIKEVHRFRPVAPIGVPHATTADETYGEFFIAKGSLVFMNIWGIYHDEQSFENPDMFNPDRFLHSEFGTKPGIDISGRRHDMSFGSGRRICPGQELANNSLILNTLNLLWAFDFGLAQDPIKGQSIPVDVNDMTDGVSSAPNPFRCEIRPRSEVHAEIIRSEYANARHVFSQFEQELSKEDVEYVAKW